MNCVLLGAFTRKSAESKKVKKDYSFTKGISSIKRGKCLGTTLLDSGFRRNDMYLSHFVIPAKAVIQGNQPLLDSRLRGSDGLLVCILIDLRRKVNFSGFFLNIFRHLMLISPFGPRSEAVFS